VSDKKNLAIAG